MHKDKEETKQTGLLDLAQYIHPCFGGRVRMEKEIDKRQQIESGVNTEILLVFLIAFIYPNLKGGERQKTSLPRYKE